MQKHGLIKFPVTSWTNLKENSAILPCLALVMMYLTVNAVFVLKYGSRIVTHGSLLAALYLVTVPAAFRLLTRLPSRIFTDRTYIVIVIAFSVFMGIVLLTIPQESLRVDRYEMIKLFWDNTLARINPYTPRGIHTNIPGPFPCYFILALPFYLCKEIGLLSLTGFLFFSYLLYRSGASMKSRTIALLLLAGSPAFAWEITCRSTIFLNMVLVVGLIQQMERWSKGGFTARASIGYGLLTGFIACTRSVTILVLVPYFLYLWYNNSRAPRPVLYSAAAFGAFAIPFIPFLAYTSFFHGYNPFAVQTSIMPGWATAIVGLISCAVALRLRSFAGFVFFQTLCIFSIAFIFVSTQIIRYGWHNSLIGDRADISYLLLAFPFLFISIALIQLPSPAGAVGDRVTPTSFYGRNNKG